jgi:hypothetical protein
MPQPESISTVWRKRRLRAILRTDEYTDLLEPYALPEDFSVSTDQMVSLETYLADDPWTGVAEVLLWVQLVSGDKYYGIFNETKLKLGLEPIATYSLKWLTDQVIDVSNRMMMNTWMRVDLHTEPLLAREIPQERSIFFSTLNQAQEKNAA